MTRLSRFYGFHL
uniref:Uncharacterized protein n=1 Tax=Arundo donax TaxID=35708 RepID=A0A0A9BTW5_ARUDO